MAETVESQILKPYVAADRIEIIRVAITGLLAGAVVPLLAALLASLLIKPVFCGNGQLTGICAEGGDITAYHTAAVIIGFVTVTLFANWGVFRPLPLVVGVTAALWGLRTYLSAFDNNSAELFIYTVLFSGLSYMLFYWLMRLRRFTVSIVSALVCALVIYLMFTF